MNVNKNTVIATLCALSTKLASQLDNHEYSHDCFCPLSDFKGDFRFDDKYLEFIKDAVKEKYERETGREWEEFSLLDTENQ